MEDKPISARSDNSKLEIDNTILYKDRYVSITREQIVIYSYYFPTATSKKIDLNDIKRIIIQEITTFTGKYKLWGMNYQCLWFPLDATRYMKDKCLILDLGSCINPAITPDNVETVYNILQAHIKNNSNV